MELWDKYQKRCQQAEERIRFRVAYQKVANHGDIDIVKLGRYLGLCRGDDFVLLPAFDELVFVSDSLLALCRIDQQWMVFTVDTGEPLVDQSFPMQPVYHESQQTLEVVDATGHHGLYDVYSCRWAVPTAYDEVSACASFPYVWVRRGDSWGFVETGTGETGPVKEMLVPGATMAFDAEKGRFVVLNGAVICLDERGISDPRQLRRYVLNNHGRGTATNSNYYETVVFDVYGHIL